VTSPKEKRFVSRGMIKLLDSDLRKTQEKIVKSICVSEYVHRYFSKLLKRKITTLTDYAIVEEIICDYYNMLTNIYNTINKKTNSAFVLHPFFSPSPASFDYYHVRIVSGIETSFENLAEIGSFSAFDNNGVVSFKKDFDFWVCGRNKLYFISEILKTRNIREIEVVSSDKKEIMRFDIKEHL
jgi:hypothetical protein